MIYTKNKAEELDDTLFANPTAEYRGIPFWSWNCEVTEEYIDWQLDCFRQMGFGGVDIHPRTGLDTEYLGEEYLRLTEYTARRCEEKGLYCWLYDDDRFPSGSAGGIVTKNPLFRGRYLLLTEKHCGGKEAGALLPGFCGDRETFEAAVRKGEKPPGYFACAYSIELHEKCLSGYRRLRTQQEIGSALKNGERVRFAYVKLIEEERWFEHQAYVDTMNPRAIRAFVESTHEKYARLLGERFGKSVPAIFTDEPRMAPRKKKTQKIAFAESEEDIIIPYTEYFAYQMEKRYGTDVLEKLPEYIWELPEGKLSAFRYRYQDTLAECFTEAFMDQLCDWCGEHGIAMTGHVLGEDTVMGQAYLLGDCMRCYRKMDLPGVDVLVDFRQFITVKQAVSVTRQNGKEGTVSELYGVTEWDCNFKTYKLQGDWQAALGITIRVPHLSWMSMEGEAKRDWPASIFYQSPWYTEFSYLEDYFSRLNTVLTRGKACARVAMLHPVESAWLYMGPNDQSADVLALMDERLEQITRWLLFGSVDFDFLSEALIPRQCAAYLRNPGEELLVGEMGYRVILAPDMRSIRSATLQLMELFAGKGGKIIFAGRVPEYVDGIKSDRALRLAEKCAVIPWEKPELMKELQPYRDIEIRKADGSRADRLFYQLRQDQNCKWLFLCHVYDKRQHLSESEEYRVRLKGEYEMTLYGALDGQQRPWDGARSGGWTEFTWNCHAHDSLLLCLRESGGHAKQETLKTGGKDKFETIASLTRADAYARQEKNVLLLDYARARIDDGAILEKEEILRLDNRIRERLGFALRDGESEQPWFLEEKESHKVTLFYTFRSEINADAFLGIERPENCKVWLNGEAAATEPLGYYVDRAISVIPLPGVRMGENELKLEVRYHQKTNLENLYLLGDFAVELRGAGAVIRDWKEALGIGDITRQGMPFYTGNLDYRFSFRVEEPGEYYVQVRDFEAPLLSVELDGKEAGRLAFAPHRLCLGRLTSGEHRLDIRLFGNRFNGFGYLHNPNREFTWFGPDAYRTVGDDWTDCYLVRPVGILSAVEIQRKSSRRFCRRSTMRRRTSD